MAAKSDKPDRFEALDEPDSGRRFGAGAVGVGLLAIALGAFVVQNPDDVKVEWLFFSFTLPLWLLLVVTSALALVLGELVGWLWRRRKRED